MLLVEGLRHAGSIPAVSKHFHRIAMPKTKARRVARKKTLSVASAVKLFIREGGYCAGADVSAAVSDKIAAMLTQAMARTAANGRRVVRPTDL